MPSRVKGCVSLENISAKFHSWMERNLEEPFFRAEMVKAEPSGSKNGFSSKIHFSAAAGMILLVAWLIVSVVR